MKCLNPECDSLNADELNISVNISITSAGSEEPDYEGWTEYGNDLIAIGTFCPDCEKSVIDRDIVSHDVLTFLGYERWIQ